MTLSRLWSSGVVFVFILFGSISAFAHVDESVDDYELWPGVDESTVMPFACKRATKKQIATVNSGNSKRSQFLARCYSETANSAWCDQLVRPNPASKATFACTYGNTQTHMLIHPTESTWKYAIRAVNLIRTLEAKGIRVCQIYNWWRPEPYNQNVGGAAGRHPYGTSVDVRFCSDQEAVTGFYELCKLRREGKIRAIGYYGSTGLHFGVGDSKANTWGMSCP